MSSCAVIGSTKIAEIHVREFIKNGIKDITLISRNKNKSKKFAENLSIKLKINLKFSNYQIFKRKKFKMISICSNTKYHLLHLKKLQSVKSKILVEKPLIPLKNDYNLNGTLDSIYSSNRNIFISYPMHYLALTFIKKFNFKKKIKSINVYYQTRGGHSGSEIFFDLAPHVLLIIIILLKKKLDKITILKKKIKKNIFFISFKSLSINHEIELLQLKNRKKSIFKFKINNQNVRRYTNNINNILYNFLEYKNKKILIENPMAMVIENFIKHDYRNKTYKTNKNLTYTLSNLTKKIYDQTL
jgi:hypothetical protein